MGSRVHIRFIFLWLFRARSVWLRLKYTDRPTDDFDLVPQGIHTADLQVSKPLVVGMLAGSAVGTWL
jgi:hypothetical protein